MSTQDATSPVDNTDGSGDVVRPGDQQEEVVTSPGGLRSMKDQFEGGNVSNVEVKKMMDDEVIRPTTMQNEENAPEGINASGISENEPIVRDDVVRAGTPSDDPMSVSGGTRSIKDRFEKGQVIKEDEGEVTSPGKIDVSKEIEEAKRREEEVRKAEPTVSENEPVIRDDVVRSGDVNEDIYMESGALGSLKDRFEKGAFSNVEDTPKKDPIKIGSLDNYNNAESSQGGVSENTPVVRDDVVRSSDTKEDLGFKSGTSRNLRAMFESGPVSNLEQKPREKIDISPRSLEDSYAANDTVTDSGVSENTPIVRDDVVKSGSSADEPVVKVGGLRNLKSLFESGPVSNIEVKPRQVAKHKPAGLDTMDPTSNVAVAENTPEVRDDLVRETPRSDAVDVASGHSRSLKNKWEAGEVDRPETNYKTVISKEEPQIAESKPEPQREDVVTGDSETAQVHIETGSSKSLKERFESDEEEEPQQHQEPLEETAEETPEVEQPQEVDTHQENGTPEENGGVHEENGTHENGDGEQLAAEEQNGIIEDGMSPVEEQQPEETTPYQENASLEIKAARASALADSPVDGEDNAEIAM